MAEEHAKVYVEEVLEMDEKDPKYENKQVVENYECK